MSASCAVANSLSNTNSKNITLITESRLIGKKISWQTSTAPTESNTKTKSFMSKRVIMGFAACFMVGMSIPLTRTLLTVKSFSKSSRKISAENMTITIKIEDQESIGDVKAIGAKDLLEYFLPKAGICATKVTVYECEPEQTKGMLRGESYSYYQDIAEQ